jgi:aromatic ring-opening dioxygenase catalytic subunit (LigB family)
MLPPRRTCTPIGPLPLLGDPAHKGLTKFLKSVSASLLPRKPDAVLCVTAHWETSHPTVSTSPAPPMLYDYGGFPEESYRIQYPAPGRPELAQRVVGLLKCV